MGDLGDEMFTAPLMIKLWNSCFPYVKRIFPMGSTDANQIVESSFDFSVVDSNSFLFLFKYAPEVAKELHIGPEFSLEAANISKRETWMVLHYQICDMRSFIPFFSNGSPCLTAWILCRCSFLYPSYSQKAWNSLQPVMRFQSNMSISRICLLLSLIQFLVMDLEEFIWNFP